MDIITQFKESIIQIVQDYKSRKFVIAVGIIAIIVLSIKENWGLSDYHLQLIVIVGGAYVIIEGLADIVSRIMDKFFPKDEIKTETLPEETSTTPQVG